MLRIHFLTSTFLASLVTASDVLGQRSVITARAVLPPRALYGRQNQFTCAQATDTVCADGSGCCPGGAACFVSSGVGLCSVTCEAAQPTCVFNGVTACCPVGDACGGSLCIPAGMNTGLPDLSSMAAPPPTTSVAALVVETPSVDSVIAVSSSVASVASVASVDVPSSQAYAYSVISMSVAGGVNASIAIVSSTTSITTTPSAMASTATFGLGTRPTASGPLQVSVNAAPTPVSFGALVNLAGLAALGLAL